MSSTCELAGTDSGSWAIKSPCPMKPPVPREVLFVRQQPAPTHANPRRIGLHRIAQASRRSEGQLPDRHSAALCSDWSGWLREHRGFAFAADTMSSSRSTEWARQ